MGGSGAGGAKAQELEIDGLAAVDDPEDSVIATRAPSAPQMRRLGRYRLVREIATGGMASVNLAVADGVDKLVALKMIHANLAQEDAFVNMFLDEARIASAISHRNVCNVFDFGECDGRYFLAMDYLSGQSLRDVIQRLRKMPDLAPPERLSVFAATVISEACEGLHAAHELRDAQGNPLEVVHRDVSPHNLFVTYEGSVSVVDFGIARASDRIQHTATGVLKGKFSYMAPEQIRQLEIDRRVDVWSLGVCLWETLTLERLFVRHSQADTLMSVMMDRVRPPSEMHAGIPKALDEIVMRALARSPAQRYATARDLGRDLAKFVRETGAAMDTVEIEQWLARLFPQEIEDNRTLLRNARLATLEEAQWNESTPSIAMRTPTRSGAMLRARNSLTPSRANHPSHELLLDAAPDNDVEAEKGHDQPYNAALRQTGKPVRGRPQKHKLAALLLALCVGGGVATYVNVGATATTLPAQSASALRIEHRDIANSRPIQTGVLLNKPQPSAALEQPSSPIASSPITKVAPIPANAVHTRSQKQMPSVTAANSPIPANAPRGAVAPRLESASSQPKAAAVDAGAAASEAKSAAPMPGDVLVAATPAVAPEAQHLAAAVAAAAVVPSPAPVVVAPKPAEKLDAVPRVGEVAVEGSLGTGVVSRMLSRAEPLLRGCYVDAARKASKNQYVPLAIALTIDETGAVRRIMPAKHALPGLSECAANELKKLRSDRKPDVGTVNVHFSVSFKAP